jgi:hypothetical protein
MNLFRAQRMSFYDVRMPFGQYRGKLLSDVPRDYLLWALREAAAVRRDPSLALAIRRRLGIDTNAGAPPPPPPRPAADFPGVVKTWYRDLSLKYHPDRGGSNAAMIIVNEAYDHLCSLMKRKGIG